MMLKQDSRSLRRTWTLMELLVVIAIIAILLSLLYPTFAKTRDKTRNVTCKSNLKQLAIAYELVTANGVDVNKDGDMNGISGIMNGQVDMRRGDILQRGWFVGLGVYIQAELTGRNITKGKKSYSCPQIGTPEVMDWDMIAYNPNIYGARTSDSSVGGISLKRSSIVKPAESLMMMDGGQTHSGEANWSTGSAWYFGYIANWEWSTNLKDEIKANRHAGKQNFTRWDGSLSELSVEEMRSNSSALLKLN